MIRDAQAGLRRAVKWRAALGVAALACGFAMACLANAGPARAPAVIALPAARADPQPSSPASPRVADAVGDGLPADTKDAGPAGSGHGAQGKANALAQCLTELTGVAVSPLLVFSGLGAYQYFFLPTPPEGPRPLHTHPLVWGTFLLILGITWIASAGAIAIPSPLKSVIDSAQYLQENVTGLLAAGMLIPTLSRTLVTAGVDPSAIGMGGGGPACIQAGFLSALNEVSVQILMLLMFMAVRVVSLVVDALIVISPIAMVDTLLRLMRGSVVAIGGGVSWALLQSEWGSVILVALILVAVIICLAIGGWCVRFNLFAASCAWDILTLRGSRVRPHLGPVRAFAAGGALGMAIRTRGILEMTDGTLCFRWRPWFVLPARSVPVDSQRLTLVRGLVIHSVTRRVSDETAEDLLLLPPRYRAYHDTLAGRMGVPVEDGAIRRGLKAAWQFLKGIVSRGSLASGPARASAPALALAGANGPLAAREVGTGTASEPTSQPSPHAGGSRASVLDDVQDRMSIGAGMTVGSVQRDFTSKFPSLGLILFSMEAADRAKRGERVRPLDSSEVLARGSSDRRSGRFDVSASTSVGALEGHFRDEYGILAQVCYMHEGKPVVTAGSLDAASLAALNRRATEQGRGAFRYPGQ